MLVKFGVHYDKLRTPARDALPIVDRVHKTHYGEEAVLTSTYEGNHGLNSYHYIHLATDFRRLDSYAEKAYQFMTDVIGELIRKLGPGYQMVIKSDHFHLEYDLKAAGKAGEL